MTNLDYSRPCPHTDADGRPISCSEAERQAAQAPRPLSLNEAGHLADLIRGVETNARLYYYPIGSEGRGDPPVGRYVLRSFTHDGGGLWFDKDGDVRDAYVWCSGIGELWLKVSDLMRALENAIEGRYGLGEPMARIEARS